MDAALTPPQQKRHMYIPPEIVEEILSNLPLKSLFRFTSVCKLWNSLIWEPRFTRKHKSRALLLCRNRFVIYINFDSFEVATLTAFSSISSDELPQKVINMETHTSEDHLSFSFVSEGPIEHMTDFAGQFQEKPYLRALCDELWCVEVGDHLFLWNPSIRSYRKLPPPLFKLHPESEYDYDCIYGLAYDSEGDDYKILKIGRESFVEIEIYTLKNNGWRKIESYSSAQPYYPQERCEFVGGRFHWIGITTANTPVIVSFNLSTEKYKELALPKYDAELDDDDADYDDGDKDDQIEVVVLRGKLCVFRNYNGWFELWVMEEYGVEKSWTKKFQCESRHHYDKETIKPVYYYDNDDILVKEYDIDTGDMKLVLYKKGKGRSSKIIVDCSDKSSPFYKGDAFLYVETLISPSALYNK